MTSAARRPAGELESAVLEALWAAAEPMTVRDVRTALGGNLARTTITTILSRLHVKGVLRRTRSGRGYAYSPVVEDQAALSAGRMHKELDKSGAERPSVLARFVSDLNANDERLLRVLLEQAGHADEPTS
ncbi:BlaI/MecI/CopY family transcriptional regulator [Actinomadura darangshiensis]|uniref:BlaI/MecI/CopY family transcriptional regulator n=1 Tax=Actinomadura darangshiensis TaxID=705336 RepID=A0A4R5BDR3_9ACTN|nr:BlaI/MecI/CopY family transcriptional regulator [Actinomadura darangshiensis]TDD81924.1 BlaI/MecI/CopY family transcriptional regulator [Actinomadura darangshiensis]